MPSRSPATPKDVADLANKSAPEIAKLILEVRRQVLARMPKAVEQVKPGWGVLWYGTGPKMTEQILAISPHKGHVNLEFARGTELPDPGGHLEGSGKRIRHVKIRDPKDLGVAAVKGLIDEAVAAGPPDWPARAKPRAKRK